MNSTIRTLHLHCFPHSGGLPHQLRPLVQSLSPATSTIVNYSMDPDGNRADPNSIEQVAATWVPALQDNAHRTVLYGHSVGGLAAFETAAQLEAADKPVHRVVIAAARPVPLDRQIALDPTTATDDELFNWSFNSVHGRAATQADREVFDHFASSLRRDLQLVARYRPTRRLSATPAAFLASTADPICPLTASHEWNPLIDRIDILSITGSHLFHIMHPQTTSDLVARWVIDPQTTSELLASG